MKTIKNRKKPENIQVLCTRLINSSNANCLYGLRISVCFTHRPICLNDIFVNNMFYTMWPACSE